MEPAIQVNHLSKDPCQLYRDLVPVNIVLRQVLAIVDSASLYKLHDQHALVSVQNLGYRSRLNISIPSQSAKLTDV